MGHKGVSKRKPKKSSLSSGEVNSISSGLNTAEKLPLQPFLANNGASLNKSGANPAAGSNKKHKKGK